MSSVCVLLWIIIPVIYGTLQVEGYSDLQHRQRQVTEPDILTRYLNVERLAANTVFIEELQSEQETEDWITDYAGFQLAKQRSKGRPAFKTGKIRKMFGWGDFHCSIKTESLDLLIKGKVVDHGNGTLTIHFLCNITGVGNITIGLAPSTKKVDFEFIQQEDQESVESKLFNCRVESEKVEQRKKGMQCSYSTSKSCEHQQTHTHISWLCSKPFKVICDIVSFRSVNYKLLQKVCPDYNHHSDAPYFRSG